MRWWARRLGELACEDQALPPELRLEVTTQTARVAAVADGRGTRTPQGRHIWRVGELAALLRACAEDLTPAGVRAAPVLALAWTTGTRRGELAGLTWADYGETGADEGELMIRGKGDKTRVAYVYNGAASYLADWLVLLGEAADLLFYAVNQGGAMQVGHGLSNEALA